MKKNKITIDSQLISKYNIKGPRYTSYPTTPEWKFPSSSDCMINTAFQSIKNSDNNIALYIHIPFCEKTCFFCSCSMIPQGKLREEKSLRYLSFLEKEMKIINKRIGKKRISHLHLGGGTPNFFPVPIMKRLLSLLHENFDLTHQAEQSIEVDPRHLDEEYINTLAQLNFNRISMGIQDFTPQVQQNINRVQSYELIKTTCQLIRKHNIPINFDLVYGLPGQTKQSFEQSCKQVITLKPDRIALYSFAYLPHMKKHHTLFQENQLPPPQEKIDTFIQSRSQLLTAGYQAIGMDHFALPEDSLSHQFQQKKLFRNFMGYSLQYSEDMIGLGYSSISFVSHTYLQNTKSLKQYEESLDKGTLPIVNGHPLTTDDRIRKWCIDKIMCEFLINKHEFKQLFNKEFELYFSKEKKQWEKLEKEKLLINTKDEMKTTELGQFFVRNIALQFDAYFNNPDSFKNFSKTI